MLDVQISSVQITILGTAAMSVYSGELKSNFMSWALSVLAVSIFISSFIIVLLKGMQWIAKNMSRGGSEAARAIRAWGCPNR